MVPKRIWLSYNNKLTSVRTQGLEFVDDLAKAARNEFSPHLCDFASSDITLHVNEDAEALATDSALAEITAQLSPCGVSKTPLIVKGELRSSLHSVLVQALVPAILSSSSRCALVPLPARL
jgi:hypothetical protein